MSDANQFREPKSIDDAKSRRLQLLNQKREFENMMSGPKGTIGGRRVSLREYDSWRAEQTIAIRRNEDELAWLKQWIAAKYKRARVDTLEATEGSDPSAVMKAARDATVNLCRLVGVLQREIEQLRNENTAMRNRLAAIDNPQPVAPNDGRDEWRDNPINPVGKEA